MNKSEQDAQEVIVEKTTWGQRITQAELKSEFTAQDIAKAHNWCTCAVSEHIDFATDKFYDSNLHLSRDAGVLGRAFHNAVMDNNFAKARKIYHKIGKLDKVFTYGDVINDLG